MKWTELLKSEVETSYATTAKLLEMGLGIAGRLKG
jgi:hypothetical protein